MASSRHLRRSRRSSPLNNSLPESLSIKAEPLLVTKIEDMSEEWVEPPLRTPAPSFEDYKGLERHGVLEHMAPLGTLPGSKVRARLKQHEPPRRIVHLKNGDARGARVDITTPEPAAPALAKRSEPRRAEGKVTRVSSSSRERDEDHDYTPKGYSARATSTKVAPPYAVREDTHALRNPAQQLKLVKIVESAIERSHDLGDPALGNAVRELYEESLQNGTMADLLDAVLTQKPTPQQAVEFQSYIRAAKKKIKASEHSGSKSLSKSPASKISRTSVTRAPKAPVANHHRRDSKPQTSTKQPDNMTVNGNSPKDERQPKRLKRSKSASSDSSLSSLDSAIDELTSEVEVPPLTNANSRPTNHKNAQSKPQPSLGPRLGSFTTRPSDVSRKPILPTTSPTPDDLMAKRRERLKQDFQDVVVQPSAIRAAPSPLHAPNNSPVAILAERTQQARLRNGSGRTSKKDDQDSLDSPLSSNFSDLLVPPPPGASRGTTPNQLARPSKAFKKAARIKMSPLKKSRGVTAGIGRMAECDISVAGNKRTDDGQSIDNSDFCSSCSGNGKLICCDGCPRSYHFTCCDPPMDPDEVPDTEWYCNACEEKRKKWRTPASLDSPSSLAPSVHGIFFRLVVDLDKRNPYSFSLPLALRDFFEGVKTGEEGEYEPVGAVKPSRTRAGYEEVPNNFKLKDNKENSILCFHCGLSSMGKHPSMPARELACCDFCHMSWHLDCLDPPLATAPVKRGNGSSKIQWMCPLHVEGELLNRDPNVKTSGTTEHKLTGRPYKVRRPKNPTVINIGLHRGFKNNGLIEIEDEESDIGEEYERNVSGVIYRVPAQGIKLDFIDRGKRANAEAVQAKQRKRAMAATSLYVAEDNEATTEFTNRPDVPLEQRPFSERKAALNLAQMARSDARLNPDKVKNLINTLTAEAPSDVEKLLAAKDNVLPEMTVEERKDIEALIALASRRLAGSRPTTT